MSRRCRWSCSGSRFDVTWVARKPSFLTSVGPQPQARQPQRADGRVQGVQTDAGIDQRRQRHVAADAAAAIEIGDSCHRTPPLWQVSLRQDGNDAELDLRWASLARVPPLTRLEAELLVGGVR